MDGPLRGSALQDPLASSIVGLVEALQQGLEIAVAGHRDPEHLGLDASVEALHHAIGAGRIGPRFAVLHPERPAGRLEPGGREAGAAVREHMGDLEGEGLDRFIQEGDGAGRGFIVLDREMDEAGGAVDGDIEVALGGSACGSRRWRS